MISAQEALARLQEGNRRFASGEWKRDHLADRTRRADLIEGQDPIAIILSCSDSRVPTEIVFDQGIGDLFVVRAAGNIVAPTQAGSIEYAVEQFGTRLVVVLGHSQCGAVMATVDELMKQAKRSTGNLRSIMDRIRPSVEPLLTTDLRYDRGLLVEQAVRANVRASVDQLKEASELLAQRSELDRLLIVGAEYALETGIVEFF